MMGIVVPETCWGYKKYNQVESNWFLFFNHLISFLVSGYMVSNGIDTSDKDELEKMEKKKHAWLIWGEVPKFTWTDRGVSWKLYQNR